MFLSFFKKKIYLFTFGQAGPLLLGGLFCGCGKRESLSSCNVPASHCGGFSHGVQTAGCMGSSSQLTKRVGSVVAVRRFYSCGTQVQLLRGMWNLPRSGIEPISPALAGSFLPTVPPGESHSFLSDQSSFILIQENTGIKSTGLI